MDWNAAIDKHREALKRVLAALVSMAGLDAAFTSPLWGGRRGWPQGQSDPGGGDALPMTPTLRPDDRRPPHKGEVDPGRPTLPRHLHRAVLRLLRPAEAAARRLVIVAARGLVLPPPAAPRTRKPVARRTPPPPRFTRSLAGASHLSRPSFGPPVNGGGSSAAPYPARIAFPLFDPPRRFRRRLRPSASPHVPRISIPGWSTPFPVPVLSQPAPDDPIDATRLTLRLAALARALDDLPREARRFARWRARDAAGTQIRENRGVSGPQASRPDAGRLRRIWPLRHGRPPGQRPAHSRRPVHAVHRILDDVHGLAFWVLEAPDTS